MSSGKSANEVFNSTTSRLNDLRLDEPTQNQNGAQYLAVDSVPQNMLPSNAPNNHQSHLHSSGIDRDNVTGSNCYTHSSRRQSSNSSSGSNSASSSQASSSSQSLHSNSHPVYNWQATKTTVKERFAFMFNNEILCDVHFIVGRDIQQQRIPAHKFVLSVGSAVFDAMFLYSDEVQIGPETVMTTLYTAKKYAVPALEKHCVDFLKSNLGSDNAFMLLTQARLFDEPQLAALCLEMIDKNTTEALGADGFTDIDLDTLNAVLERDTLRIREAKLFQAVVRWSEAECSRQQLPATPENKRSVLGRALTLVRFPLMSVEEFAVGAAQSGLLSDREVVSLFLYFTVNPKPAVGFLEVPRCCMTGKEQTVNRFQQIESRWGYSGTCDRIRYDY
ncbi:BTB/POZ domain-containing protein 2 [Blattella germanica]|nr:BTB/POZ domain-containing protein 2 [Blattella germanica]